MSKTRVSPLRAVGGAGLFVVAVMVACQQPEPTPSPEPPTTTETQAVHDEDLFELDGNQDNDPAVMGTDWESVGSPEVDGTNASIFTGGGSKDINDITMWANTSGSVPDKDDLQNANAITLEATDGDLILYFGADRIATNGDAQIGFWFLQDEVAPDGDGGFAGEHKEGDILVLSDFTKGGDIGTIQVCTWAGGDGTAGHLECDPESVTDVGGGVFCTPDDVACATINHDSVDSVWPYDPKSGPNDVYARGAFFEGGVNATELLGETPCFASFLVETRSSQSETATLKDFVLGELDVCEPAIQVCKQCEVALAVEGSNVVLEVGYGGWACNTGNVDLTISLEDDVDTDASLPTDLLLAAETCISYSGTYQPASLPEGETDPTLAEFTDTITMSASHSQLGDLDPLTASATCTACAASDPCDDPPFAIEE